MLTRPVRLEAVAEKYSTKWHHVHATFLYLFEGWYIPHVEQWYNTIAPIAHRESFRRTMKLIHQHNPTAIDDSVQLCKGNNMVRLYNEGLSAAGKEKAKSWVTHAASPPELEAFRDVFTGIQATFHAKSRMKETYVYRPLTDTPSKDAHRQKIDWSNTNAAALAQQQKRDEIASAGEQGTRLPKIAARQGGGGRRAMSSMGGDATSSSQDAEKQMAALQAKRAAFEQSEKYSIDPETGCSLFAATNVAANRQRESSKTRIIPSFSNGTSGWISTTREHIRNYGVRGLQANEKINPEMHPAIARQTASVGLCIPSQSTNDFLSYA